MYRTGTLAEISRAARLDRPRWQTQTTLAELGRYNQVKLSPDATKVVTSRTELETGANADLWITDLATEDERQAHVRRRREHSTGVVAGRAIRRVGWPARRGWRALSESRLTAAAARKCCTATPRTRATSRCPTGRLNGQMLVYTRGGDVFALPVGPTSSASREPFRWCSRRQLSLALRSPRTADGSPTSPTRRAGRRSTCSRSSSGRQSAADTATRPKWLFRARERGNGAMAADSRELIFLGGDGALMSVDVTATPVVQASAPQALFQFPSQFHRPVGHAWRARRRDARPAAADRCRSVRSRPASDLSVVLNWQNDQRRRP